MNQILKVFILLGLWGSLWIGFEPLLAQEMIINQHKETKNTIKENFNINNQSANQEKVTEVNQQSIQQTVLGMNVSGNKEAPNLLYIIPWKESHQATKPLKINRLMDEIFSTLDPEVFIKEVTYYEKINILESQ